jgi:hypothetical protein
MKRNVSEAGQTAPINGILVLRPNLILMEKKKRKSEVIFRNLEQKLHRFVHHNQGHHIGLLWLSVSGKYSGVCD